MARQELAYTTKDISVVIPAYNRPEDLKKTFKSLLKFAKDLNEIIVVDQSKDDLTKKLVKSFKIKNLRYVFSETPSITIARNLGVKKASKKSKIVCFLDDDIVLGENYFSEILKIFNKHPEAKAVAGKSFSAKPPKLENLLKRIFFLGYLEKESARMVSAYGNTHPENLKKVINVQWLPGVNMAYKKEVFNEQKFDENLLGYTVTEDTGFSYGLYKKHKDSLFLTPNAKIVHRASTVARTPTKRLAYINQVDHFYLNFKQFNSNTREKIIFVWVIFGITLLRTLNMLFKPTKNNYLNWNYFIKSLFYCLTNLNKIKKGRVRDFRV